MNKKGFTLIELLVVIAIIGILSSVAIVYLSDARQKANDAKVQSNVTTVSTQLEIDRANGETITQDVIDDIIDKIGQYPCPGTNRAGWGTDADDTFDNVAISAELCSTATTADTTDVAFCADSTGYRGTTTLATAYGDDDGKCLE